MFPVSTHVNSRSLLSHSRFQLGEFFAPILFALYFLTSFARADLPSGVQGLGAFYPTEFKKYSGGHMPEIVHVFNATDNRGCKYCNYSRIDDPSWAIGRVRDFVNGNPSQRWGLISQQLINRGETLGQCVSGKFDHHWVTYGKKLSSTRHVIIRLGWEVGDGFPWDNGTPAQYGACFKRVGGIIKKYAPSVKLEYNVHQMHLGLLDKAYPGSIVDFVGTDLYDTRYTRVCNDTCKQKVALQQKARLETVRNFAKARGKRLAVSEWGLRSRTNGGFGDNPQFIRNMADYFRSHSNNGTFGYAVYFNGGDSNLAKYPNSARAFNDEY